MSCYVYDFIKFAILVGGINVYSVKGATINGVTYAGVAEFIYWGTLISNDNSVEEEIQRRILAGSRTYFAVISLFRSPEPLKLYYIRH